METPEGPLNLSHLSRLLGSLTTSLQKLPGSKILVRYVRSSYQNDPVRSAVELFLFLFFIRYLLAPSYSTKDAGSIGVGRGRGGGAGLDDDVSFFLVFLFYSALFGSRGSPPGGKRVDLRGGGGVMGDGVRE